MPLDFAKLNDPFVRAQAQANRVSEMAQLEARDKLRRRQIDVVLANIDMLDDAERRFIRSCASRPSWDELTEKQESWLKDIVTRAETLLQTRIVQLVDVVAAGKVSGQHPRYPRKPEYVDDQIYWEWVLLMLDLDGVEDAQNAGTASH